MESIQTHAAQPANTIEFWFDFGSNYSYLSMMRIEDDAARLGVKVIWRPFLLGAIFKSLGWDSSPFLQQQAKAAYMWQDMARQCRKYELRWRKPSQFPRRALLPMRVALLGAEQPWMGEYCRQIMSLNFAEDRDIDSPEAVTEVLAQLGLPAAELIETAQSAVNKLKLREQTNAAESRGIFGAPTFFVQDEMFWGNDRLDDALDFAAQQGRR